MNGLDRAVNSESLSHFLQGRVGCFRQHRPQLPTVLTQELRLAAREPMPRSQISRAPQLTEELFHKSEGYPISLGQIGLGAFALLIGNGNALPQIERDCYHPPTVSNPCPDVHTFI